MVDFTVIAEKRKLEIQWFYDDSIKKVYLFICPLTPFKLFHEEKELKIENSQGAYIDPRTVYKAQCQILDLPKLHNATYRFSLFNNESGTGEPLCTKEAYIGRKVPFEIKRWPHREKLEKLTITCSYKVREELFWLSFSKIKSSGRFYLPPMKEKEGRYITSCFLAQGAYERLVFCLDSSIEDSFFTEYIS